MKKNKKNLFTIFLILAIVTVSIPQKAYAYAFNGILSKYFSSTSKMSEDELYEEKKKLSSSELIEEIIEIEKNINGEDEMCLLSHFTALIEKSNEFSSDELIRLIKEPNTLTGIDQAFVKMYSKNNYDATQLLSLLDNSEISDETKEYIVAISDFTIDELHDIFKNSNGKTSIVAMKRIAANNPEMAFELVDSMRVDSTNTDDEYISFCLGTASFFEEKTYKMSQSEIKDHYVAKLKDIYSKNDNQLVKDQAIYALGRICDYDLFTWIINSEDIDFELKVSVIERNIELMKNQISKSKSINDMNTIILAMEMHPIVNIAEELSKAIENEELERCEELSEIINKINNEGIRLVDKYEW